MKPSQCARYAAELYDASQAFNCCHALSMYQRGLPYRFQREFAGRVFIDIDGILDDMSASEIDQFRVFLLLFFAEWLRDQGE